MTKENRRARDKFTHLGLLEVISGMTKTEAEKLDKFTHPGLLDLMSGITETERSGKTRSIHANSRTLGF
jgi:hypothetical protein